MAEANTHTIDRVIEHCEENISVSACNRQGEEGESGQKTTTKDFWAQSQGCCWNLVKNQQQSATGENGNIQSQQDHPQSKPNRSIQIQNLDKNDIRDNPSLFSSFAVNTAPDK